MDKSSKINEQIKNIAKTIGEQSCVSSEEFTQTLTQQIMVNAVGLAIQNAVAQQQQNYILRNAMTTAAARAMLESSLSPEDIMKFAKDALSGEDVISTLSGLKDLMDKVSSQDKIRKTDKKTTSSPGKKTKDDLKKPENI